MSKWIPFRRQQEYRYGGNIRAEIAMFGKFRNDISLEYLENDPDLSEWIQEWQDWLSDMAKSETPPISAVGIYESERVKMQVNCTLDLIEADVKC